MNNETFLDALDPEILAQMTSRRDALRKTGLFGAGLALASVPLGLASLAKSAFAQGTGLPANIASVLNFALLLEELEAEFYVIGTGGALPTGTTVNRNMNLVPVVDRNIFATIREHEVAHVAFLREALGMQAIAKPNFDFTAGGAFADVFTNYQTFLALAQAFEDTGVRAYKGQAANLFSNKDILEAALSIHSVEARHASEVRRLRGNFSEQAPQKGWITGNMAPGLPAAIYAGEENVQQGAPPAPAPGINVATMSLGTALTPPVAQATAASEAFDEPLTRAQVIAIVQPFVPGVTLS